MAQAKRRWSVLVWIRDVAWVPAFAKPRVAVEDTMALDSYIPSLLP